MSSTKVPSTSILLKRHIGDGSYHKLEPYFKQIESVSNKSRVLDLHVNYFLAKFIKDLDYVEDLTLTGRMMNLIEFQRLEPDDWNSICKINLSAFDKITYTNNDVLYAGNVGDEWNEFFKYKWSSIRDFGISQMG